MYAHFSVYFWTVQHPILDIPSFLMLADLKYKKGFSLRKLNNCIRITDMPGHAECISFTPVYYTVEQCTWLFIWRERFIRYNDLVINKLGTQCIATDFLKPVSPQWMIWCADCQNGQTVFYFEATVRSRRFSIGTCTWWVDEYLRKTNSGKEISVVHECHSSIVNIMTRKPNGGSPRT